MIARFADHSANERTFLAWVRTTMAVVGFGLAAERLSGPATGSRGMMLSEVVLLGSGALVILVAFWRMQHLRRLIDSQDPVDGNLPSVDAILYLLVVALVFMLVAFAIHVV